MVLSVHNLLADGKTTLCPLPAARLRAASAGHPICPAARGEAGELHFSHSWASEGDFYPK